MSISVIVLGLVVAFAVAELINYRDAIRGRVVGAIERDPRGYCQDFLRRVWRPALRKLNVGVTSAKDDRRQAKKDLAKRENAFGEEGVPSAKKQIGIFAILVCWAIVAVVAACTEFVLAWGVTRHNLGFSIALMTIPVVLSYVLIHQKEELAERRSSLDSRSYNSRRIALGVALAIGLIWIGFLGHLRAERVYESEVSQVNRADGSYALAVRTATNNVDNAQRLLEQDTSDGAEAATLTYDKQQVSLMQSALAQAKNDQSAQLANLAQARAGEAKMWTIAAMIAWALECGLAFGLNPGIRLVLLKRAERRLREAKSRVRKAKAALERLNRKMERKIARRLHWAGVPVAVLDEVLMGGAATAGPVVVRDESAVPASVAPAEPGEPGEPPASVEPVVEPAGPVDVPPVDEPGDDAEPVDVPVGPTPGFDEA